MYTYVLYEMNSSFDRHYSTAIVFVRRRLAYVFKLGNYSIFL